MTFLTHILALESASPVHQQDNQHLPKTAIQYHLYTIHKGFCHLELAITAYYFLMSSSSETGGDTLSYTLFILVWSSLLPDFVSSVPYLEDSVLLQSLSLSSESLN